MPDCDGWDPEIALPLFVGTGLTLLFGFRPAALLEDMEHVAQNGLTFSHKQTAEEVLTAPAIVQPVILKSDPEIGKSEEKAVAPTTEAETKSPANSEK